MPRSAARPKRTEAPPGDGESPCPPMRGIDGFFQRHELAIIVLLCILAGIRVLIFSAAFPLFGNVDEQEHYDLVWHYAQGEVPTHIGPFSAVSRDLMARYTSPEYLATEEQSDRHLLLPPPWTFPPEIAQAIVGQLSRGLESRMNTENTQPPVYYAVAGAWYRLGQLLGFADARLIYWIRFLNALVHGLLVWTAYTFLRRLYPHSLLPRTGVPLLLAYFPQDVFYCATNDVLSPILCTIAFYSLLRIYIEGSKSRGLHIATGLAVAAALLTKTSNVTILLPLCIVVFMALRRARAAGDLRSALSRIGMMVAASTVPVMLWLARNYALTGHLSNEYEKAWFLGWGYKPLAEVLKHPVFTPAGAYTFLSELTARFWRGELVWHMTPFSGPGSDALTAVTTLASVGAAIAALLWKHDRKPPNERFAGFMGLGVLAASLTMMLALSVLFDFGDCTYPSVERPYFTSGRLMLGGLVPFLVLYVTGLDFLMARARLKLSRLGALVMLVLLITVWDVASRAVVFRSPYNRFHLPPAQASSLETPR